MREARLQAKRSVVLLAAVALAGGGLLAFFALRDRAQGPDAPEPPQFVLTTTSGDAVLEQVEAAEVVAVDGTGRPVPGTVASVGRVPAGAREARAPLPADLGRFLVRFRLRPGGSAPGADGSWQELGPYDVGAERAGARVLQVGLVLDESAGLMARVTARVRSPDGSESFQTLGAVQLAQPAPR